MASRRLRADEALLWARVMAGVRPLVPAALVPVAPVPVGMAPTQQGARAEPKPLPSVFTEKRTPSPQPASRLPSKRSATVPQNTLDGTWDRQLARGLVAPDRTVDLHGHSLASAHGLLDGALDRAVRSGERILLLITGKPPRPTSDGTGAPGIFRGAIRAAVGDWLAGSRFSHEIAAVRPAHPRHGGAGALYIVLRKGRGSQKS